MGFPCHILIPASAAIAVLSAPVAASQLDAGDFVGGVSTFGLNDQGGSSNVCAVCDSVVNFGAYRSTGGDWVSELQLTGAVNPLNGFDQDAAYVLFYQIRNTDPLGVENDALENFNVTGGRKGQPLHYTSGGYLDARTFDAFISDDTPLDTPNDLALANMGDPGDLTSVIGNQIQVAPVALTFTTDLPPSTIASPSVASGGGFEGALFEWSTGPNDPGLINPFDYSTVLWLTTDQHPTLVWAETESGGGFGAAGDVFGAVSSVPLPASVLLLGPALLGLGLAGRSRIA